MTSTISVFDIPFNDIEKKVQSWVEDAISLRFVETDQEGLAKNPSPNEILQELIMVRSRLDRLEFLLTKLTRLRGRALRAASAAQHAADDVWNQAAVEAKHAKEKRLEDYSGPRERYAEASLQSFEQIKTAREAQRLSEVCSEAYDAVKLLYYGLNGVRSDFLAMVRAYQFESSLER